MKLVLAMIAAISVAACASDAFAQFVKGNEAVGAPIGGRSNVEIAPVPKSGLAVDVRPCLAADGCNAGAWIMVETNDGLRECTEPYARPGTCRASTYGSKKISRVWLVKSRGLWLKCQYPDVKSKCVNMFAPYPSNLPTSAVQ